MRSKHYFYFGNRLSQTSNKILNQENWDSLRIDGEGGEPFAIEKNVEEYEKNCKNHREYEEVAQIICKELRSNNAQCVISCGVGKGILEWHIKRSMPQLRLECTDYTIKAIERLKMVFEACDEAYVFDMVNGDYAILKHCDYLIMYRVSTEFDRDTWRNIFRAMKKAGIKKIVFIPVGLDTYKQMLQENINHIKNMLRNRQDTFCGWLYSENEFRNMWKKQYLISKTVYYKNTAIYFLESDCK